MTVAVCIKCGSIKHGAYNDCQICGVRPETEIDLAYSLALTDHYFSLDVLREISSDMKRGAPRPSLPPEQEDYMRGAARFHIEQFGEMFGPAAPTRSRHEAPIGKISWLGQRCHPERPCFGPHVAGRVWLDCGRSLNGGEHRRHFPGRRGANSGAECGALYLGLLLLSVAQVE
jgi:hypothetical protein